MSPEAKVWSGFKKSAPNLTPVSEPGFLSFNIDGPLHLVSDPWTAGPDDALTPFGLGWLHSFHYTCSHTVEHECLCDFKSSLNLKIPSGT